MPTATDTPRLFEVKGLGGDTPNDVEYSITGATSESMPVDEPGAKIPNGARVVLTVIGEVIHPGHRRNFETIDGEREYTHTTHTHKIKAESVRVESWTAPDDGLRFDGEQVKRHLAGVESAVQGLKDAGVTSISSTIDGTTETVDL